MFPCSTFILTFEKFDTGYKKYCYINFGKEKPKDTEKKILKLAL